MTDISTNRVKRKSDNVVQDILDLPPGVIDLRYPNLLDVSSSESESGLQDDPAEIDQSVPDAAGEGTAADALYPPDYMNIIQQTLRVRADGTSVVDVIVEVEGPAGRNFDVRMTKGPQPIV